MNKTNVWSSEKIQDIDKYYYLSQEYSRYLVSCFALGFTGEPNALEYVKKCTDNVKNYSEEHSTILDVTAISNDLKKVINAYGRNLERT